MVGWPQGKNIMVDVVEESCSINGIQEAEERVRAQRGRMQAPVPKVTYPLRHTNFQCVLQANQVDSQD